MRALYGIAIRGNGTNEPIEILESLGGVNKRQYKDTFNFLYINEDTHEICHVIQQYQIPLPIVKIMTCEDFNKLYPYRIGETVFVNGVKERITNIDFHVTEIPYKVTEGKYEHWVSISCIKKEAVTQPSKTRTLEVTLETAKEWYKNGGELKTIALTIFSEQELVPLPKTWEEYWETHYAGEVIWKMPFKDTETAEAFDAFRKLMLLRDCYCDGWDANWDDDSDKYVLYFLNEEPYVDKAFYKRRPLSFPTEELAKEFLKNFEQLMIAAKRFL